jgi:hypothetical protein
MLNKMMNPFGKLSQKMQNLPSFTLLSGGV